MFWQADASHLEVRAGCGRADLNGHEEAVGAVEAENVCFAHVCERGDVRCRLRYDFDCDVKCTIAENYVLMRGFCSKDLREHCFVVPAKIDQVVQLRWESYGRALPRSFEDGSATQSSA